MSRKHHHGSLARSRKKNSRCPEYRGKLEINGVFYWLSGWIREDEFGKRYLSLSATERGEDGRPVDD